MIYVAGYKDIIPKNAIRIETTSRSTTWSRGLSPFLIGPVEICPGLESQNMENAWQFSKVYPEHLNEAGDIKLEYFQWARNGFNDTYAHRYPMGKGAIPKFSIKFDGIINDDFVGRRLDYIEARKELYIPFYSKAVEATEAFQQLQELYLTSEQDIYLVDFDAYNAQALEMSYKDVINCKTKKMGHAFVLAMMLDGYLNLRKMIADEV